MKNFLLLLMLCIIILSLIACNNTANNESGGGINNSSNTANTQNNMTIDVTRVKEIKNKSTDFTTEAGFEIKKSDSISNVKYENVFLKGNDLAQLDLLLGDDKKAILQVSKTESLITNEEKTTSLIANVDVVKVNEDNGIVSYNWEKDGFYYNLEVDDTLGEAELEPIINGFSTYAKEGTI